MGKPRWQYYGVFQEDNKLATPRGSKRIIESFAEFISNSTTGTGKAVCIMKAPAGSTDAKPANICYIGGARKRQRKGK